MSATIDSIKGATMELNLMYLRKRAGYKNRTQFAEKLGINPRTYKTYETGERKLSLEKACEIADFLDVSLDELAGRWEYVGRVSDEQQAAMDEAYRSLDEDGRKMAAASVQGMAMGRRRDAAVEKTAPPGSGGAAVAG